MTTALSQAAKIILLQMIARTVATFKRKPGKAALRKKCLKELNNYKKLQTTAIDNYYNNDLLHTFELMKNKLILCYFPNIYIKATDSLSDADIRAFTAQVAEVGEGWKVPSADQINKKVDDFLFDSDSWQKYQDNIQMQLDEMMKLLDSLYASYQQFIEEVIKDIEHPFSIDKYM